MQCATENTSDLDKGLFPLIWYLTVQVGLLIPLDCQMSFSAALFLLSHSLQDYRVPITVQVALLIALDCQMSFSAALFLLSHSLQDYRVPITVQVALLIALDCQMSFSEHYFFFHIHQRIIWCL